MYRIFRKNGTSQRKKNIKYILLFLALSAILHRFSQKGVHTNNTPHSSLTMLSSNNNPMQQNSHKNENISKPLMMYREYQHWHSQEALLRKSASESGIYNETFVIGLYACPDSAGNRFHEFFNAMIFAIAHNYTMTWKFYDELTCRRLGNRNPAMWCVNPLNSIEKCADVVHRASWIPSYDEWSPKLGLTYGRRDKNVYFFSKTSNVDFSQSEIKIPHMNKVWIPRESVVSVPLSDHISHSRTRTAQMRLKDMYSLGQYYLFGMLFDEIFSFTDSVKPAMNLISDIEYTTSIVVHSRHYKDHINGSDITTEINCIEKMMKKHKESNTDLQSCKIIILSDRNATLNGLREWVSEKTPCSPIVAAHDMEAGLFFEHGPFATRGYFQDLALARYANGGFIGTLEQSSSSSDLIRALYEYNYFSKIKKKNEEMPLLLCNIPKHVA